MAKDRDKEPKDQDRPKQEKETQAQAETEAHFLKEGAAVQSAAKEIISKPRFDPEQMKRDMEVFMSSREDEEKVRELSALYAGIGEIANRTIEFDPDLKLSPDGKRKLAEAISQLGERFFETLINHYNELENLIDKFLHELKGKGVFFLVRSTPEHYRYNQQFREGLVKMMKKMLEGKTQISDMELDKLSDKYRKIRSDAAFDSNKKANFRKETGLNTEDRVDSVLETCALRAFLKQLGAPLKEKDLQDKALARVQESFSKYFREEGRDTTDFLAALIKRILEHQKNSIAGQTYTIIQSDENMSLTFDDEDENGDLVDNPYDKLKYMLARLVQVLRVLRFIKYQKKLFRLKN